VDDSSVAASVVAGHLPLVGDESDDAVVASDGETADDEVSRERLPSGFAIRRRVEVRPVSALFGGQRHPEVGDGVEFVARGRSDVDGHPVTVQRANVNTFRPERRVEQTSLAVSLRKVYFWARMHQTQTST
jgi:hypothetical protein